MTKEERLKNKIEAKKNISADKAKVKADLLNSREYYKINSILGYSWATKFFLIGGREAGKSYAVTEYFVKQWKKYKRPFYWLRLTDKQKAKLLSNNAMNLIDPDIRRKYKLDLVTRGDRVYEVLKRGKLDVKTGKEKILEISKTPMCTVLDLSTFYGDKGQALFDSEFLDNPNMYYNICLDEMNREKNEKNSFDIVYAFYNQIENLIRSTLHNIRIICIGNLLDEASDLLASMGFIPEEFGRYKLVKNKAKLIELINELNKPKEKQDIEKIKNLKKIYYGQRAVIEYIPNGEAYNNRRLNAVANVGLPNSSTLTNEIKIDKSVISTSRLTKPEYIIKFSKDMKDWFTLWENGTIAPYNKEKKPIIAMRPYIDEVFIAKTRDDVILNFDLRNYKYQNLVTFKLFQKNINLLKPRGS